jgi:hypothetical protein
MLKVEVTGSEHPKEVTILTDDHDAELAVMNDALMAAELSPDDALFKALEDAEQGDDGNWRIVVPGDEVADMADLWGEFDAVDEVVSNLRSEALAAAEAAMDDD